MYVYVKKTCKSCGIEEGYFRKFKDLNGKQYIRSKCKICTLEDFASYRNRPKIKKHKKEYANKYWQKNMKKIQKRMKIYNHKYYLKHKDDAEYIVNKDFQ